MVQTKFRGKRPAGSLEKDFLSFFTIYMYGHGGHLGHVTSIISTNLNFHVFKS